MKVRELIESGDFTALALPSPEREINGVYIGDLLSWVMGRAGEGNAWITIMSNANILAVATLADVACIILAEGVTLDGDIVRTAMEKGVNVLSSTLSSYKIAKII